MKVLSSLHNDMGSRLMKSAMSQMGLSARALHRALKVGRTIADLAGAEQEMAKYGLNMMVRKKA
jgi:predicted ATPase with chaperone activity